MPSPMTTAPAAPGGEATVEAAPSATPQLLVPFTRSAREHVEPFIDFTSAALGANTQAFGPFDVPAYGFLRHLVLYVTATGGVNGSVTVAAREDAPWNVIQSIQLTDVNGAPLVGPIDGFSLYLLNKFGGYTNAGDPTVSPAYSAPSIGASGTGNFAFILRVPVEISGRDALGSLPNQNAASTYKLSVTLNTSAAVFSTAPGTPPVVRVRAWLEAWSQPTATDLRGMPQATVPPALGTTQFWTRYVRNIAAGNQTIQMPRVGNLIRNLIFVYRDNSSPAVRSTTELPDPLQLQWDGRIVLNIGRDIWRHYMAERYDYAGASIDTGVLVLDLTHDLDGHPGWELRDLYYPTTQATRLELVGNFGGDGGTLDIITNDIAPVGDPYVPVA